MSINHIKLHKVNDEVFPVRTSLYGNQILDNLPELVRSSRAYLSPGFWIERGVSSETHVFVARESFSREDPNCLMDVFALEVRDGVKMRPDEVFGAACSAFPCAFSEEDTSRCPTVYYYPGSRSMDSDESKYMCTFAVNRPCTSVCVCVTAFISGS